MKGWCVRTAKTHHDAGSSLDRRVIAFVIMARATALTTGGRYLQPYGPRVALRKRRRVNSQSYHLIIHHICNDDVHFFRKLMDYVESSLIFSVQYDAAFSG